MKNAPESPHIPRREFFSRLSDGLYGTALASLLGEDLFSSNPALAGHAVHDLKPRAPHYRPRAKAVIHLFMNGGPSQVDLFDPKPELARLAGSAPPRDILNKIEFADQVGGLLPSPYKFRRHGRCGMELSELLPHLGEVADDITLVRSMYGEHFNHEPAIYLMHSGRTLPNRPSLGSWVVYGLGSETRNLPGYVVLDDPKGLPINREQNWQSAWLPPVYQGTRFRAEGPPVLNLESRRKLPRDLIEAERALLRRLDTAHRNTRPMEPELDARIASYELAARMQLATSDALDLSQEDEATREMYGLNDELTRSYGTRCLMARRLVERGVRFVQIFIEGQIWDAHTNLEKSLTYSCGKTDRPRGRPGQGPQAARPAGGDPGDLGGRVRQNAPGPGRRPGRRRARPRARRLQHLDGRRRRQGGAHLRGDRRYRTQGRGPAGQRPRLPRHLLLHLLGMNYRDLVYRRHGLDERLTDQFPARVVDEILV